MAAERDSEQFEELKKQLRDRLTVDGRMYLVPLGDLYVAFSDAARIREIAAEEPFSTLRGGRMLEHAGFVDVDRLIKTAMRLAKLLELHKPIEPADDPGPWDALDGLGPPRPKQTKRK